MSEWPACSIDVDVYVGTAIETGFAPDSTRGFAVEGVIEGAVDGRGRMASSCCFVFHLLILTAAFLLWINSVPFFFSAANETVKMSSTCSAIT